MKKLFLILSVVLVSSLKASLPQDENDWELQCKLSDEASIWRSPKFIEYKYQNENGQDVISESAKGEELFFSHSKPRPGTRPRQDVTLSTTMSFQEFYCGVLRLQDARLTRDQPLMYRFVGQQYGVTFVFDNKNEITVADLFFAYKTDHGPKNPTCWSDFEGYSSNVVVGPSKAVFNKQEQTYTYGFIANPVKLFLGFAPLADGVIDTNMTLAEVRKELCKLGAIVSETQDKVRLDQKFEKAFQAPYMFVDDNYDAFMRLKQARILI